MLGITLKPFSPSPIDKELSFPELHHSVAIEYLADKIETLLLVYHNRQCWWCWTQHHSSMWVNNSKFKWGHRKKSYNWKSRNSIIITFFSCFFGWRLFDVGLKSLCLTLKSEKANLTRNVTTFQTLEKNLCLSATDKQKRYFFEWIVKKLLCRKVIVIHTIIFL